ncbi:uncharacterized protein LOC134250569 [Saccostrea cucullata]|uniref:uncharacterized protein LOC134250569 n=1 Tax=Saccostrea cuccullata TaxID=36930 RepID=UPI002ED49A27
MATGEEILSQLEQKEEEAERKKKKQKERKERAEMRRKEVEEKKNKKRKATTKKATKRKQKDSEDTNSNDDIPIPPPFDCEQDILPALSRPKRHSKKPKRYLDEDCELAAIIDDVEENDLVICTFCTSREAPSTSTCDREIDGWFLCEHCNRWFHNVCQGFDNNEAFSSTAAICQECRVFLEE